MAVWCIVLCSLQTTLRVQNVDAFVVSSAVLLNYYRVNELFRIRLQRLDVALQVYLEVSCQLYLNVNKP